MAMTTPAYNPELTSNRTPHLVSRHNLVYKIPEISRVFNYEVNIPLVSLIDKKIEGSQEINKQTIKKHLKDFQIEEAVLNSLVEDEILVQNLYLVQETISKYFSNYKLKLDYFFDAEENHESVNVIVLSSLDINAALDAEELYFENEFESIYNLSYGRFTFRVEPNVI